MNFIHACSRLVFSLSPSHHAACFCLVLLPLNITIWMAATTVQTLPELSLHSLSPHSFKAHKSLPLHPCECQCRGSDHRGSFSTDDQCLYYDDPIVIARWWWPQILSNINRRRFCLYKLSSGRIYTYKNIRTQFI